VAGASLLELIRAGDADAIAGFRDAHLGKVRSYCERACTAERLDDACDASFRDFLGRIKASEATVGELESVLLAATRSAAAGRFKVVRAPGDAHRPAKRSDEPICAAMPELLAAAANKELRGDGATVSEHVERCPTCAGTDQRMREAERAFAEDPGWLAARGGASGAAPWRKA
jgi:hypothetical protein